MKVACFLLLALICLYSGVVVEAQKHQHHCFRDVYQPRCPPTYRPHCGSDGVTYRNHCTFCNAYFRSGRRLDLRYLGRCQGSKTIE